MILLVTELFQVKLTIKALVKHHPIGSSLLGLGSLEVMCDVDAVQ